MSHNRSLPILSAAVLAVVPFTLAHGDVLLLAGVTTVPSGAVEVLGMQQEDSGYFCP